MQRTASVNAACILHFALLGADLRSGLWFKEKANSKTNMRANGRFALSGLNPSQPEGCCHCAQSVFQAPWDSDATVFCSSLTNGMCGRRFRLSHSLCNYDYGCIYRCLSVSFCQQDYAQMTGLIFLKPGRKVYEDGLSQVPFILGLLCRPKSSAITAHLIPLTQLVSVNIVLFVHSLCHS